MYISVCNSTWHRLIWLQAQKCVRQSVCSKYIVCILRTVAISHSSRRSAQGRVHINMCTSNNNNNNNKRCRLHGIIIAMRRHPDTSVHPPRTTERCHRNAATPASIVARCPQNRLKFDAWYARSFVMFRAELGSSYASASLGDVPARWNTKWLTVLVWLSSSPRRPFSLVWVNGDDCHSTSYRLRRRTLVDVDCWHEWRSRLTCLRRRMFRSPIAYSRIDDVGWNSVRRYDSVPPYPKMNFVPLSRRAFDKHNTQYRLY
jgi:hypothetical protein